MSEEAINVEMADILRHTQEQLKKANLESATHAAMVAALKRTVSQQDEKIKNMEAKKNVGRSKS